MWSFLWSILVCKMLQFLTKSYRFEQLITLFWKVDNLRLLKIHIPTFYAPAHGLHQEMLKKYMKRNFCKKIYYTSWSINLSRIKTPILSVSFIMTAFVEVWSLRNRKFKVQCDISINLGHWFFMNFNPFQCCLSNMLRKKALYIPSIVSYYFIYVYCSRSVNVTKTAKSICDKHFRLLSMDWSCT